MTILNKIGKISIVVAILVLAIFIAGCTHSYTVEQADNPVYKPKTVFEAFDDMATPETEHLITKFQLDTVFKGETDEFKRILLLRNWIKSVIPIKDFASFYPGEGNVERILDHALQGQGYDCGYFMKVQSALMGAHGYVSRTLGAGPGVRDIKDGHHGVNEIWLNQYNKWFLSDAKYDHHFEKDGIPLSALEVRAEYLKNGGTDVKMIKGPDRISIDFDDEMERPKEEFVQTYTWVTWDAFNDRFTTWPKHQTMLIMYEDDFYRNNTWFRGGKPAWIYNAPDYLILTENKDEIYFTPNTIRSDVQINKKRVKIQLHSDTPGLKEYQFKKDTKDEWTATEPELEMKLNKPKHELVFRTVNLAGVSGPEHKIVIKRE